MLVEVLASSGFSQGPRWGCPPGPYWDYNGAHPSVLNGIIVKKFRP